MNEWQPIETAPKDGTKVLLYGESSTGEKLWDVGFFHTRERGGRVPRGWISYIKNPTHWMLPDLPKEVSNG